MSLCQTLESRAEMKGSRNRAPRWSLWKMSIQWWVIVLSPSAQCCPLNTIHKPGFVLGSRVDLCPRKGSVERGGSKSTSWELAEVCCVTRVGLKSDNQDSGCHYPLVQLVQLR